MFLVPTHVSVIQIGKLYKHILENLPTDRRQGELTARSCSLLLLFLLHLLRNDQNLLRQTCSCIRLANALEDGSSLNKYIDEELVEPSKGNLDADRGSQQSIQRETVLARYLVLACHGKENVYVRENLPPAAYLVILAVRSKEVGHGLLVVTFFEENVAQTLQGCRFDAKTNATRSSMRFLCNTAGPFQDVDGRLEGVGSHVYLVVLEMEGANLYQQRRYVDGTCGGAVGSGGSGGVCVPVSVSVLVSTSSRCGYLKGVI